MSMTVEYLINLGGNAIAMAEKFAKAFVDVQNSAGTMGAATNKAEGAINALGGSLGRAAASASAASKALAGTKAEITAVGAAAKAQEASIAAFRATAARNMATKFASNPAYMPGGAKYMAPGGGGMGGGGAVAAGPGMGGHMLNAYFGAQVLGMVGHSIDHIVEKAAAVDTMRQKIAMSTNQGSADQAVDRAMELSGKYTNTTVEENLKIIDDLRANLPEKMHKIIAETAEPFVKMHSFFKAWNGGKHAGDAEKSMQDITAAVRSGELTGEITGEMMAKHAQALTVAQVTFGGKFNVPQYLQAVQKTSTALSASNDTFKYIDFPILVQALGQGGGVALRGLFDKLSSGNKVTQATAENWRELGLVDMSQVGKLDKNGKIKANQLLGKKWLKGDYGTNIADGIMTDLVPALVNKKDGKLKDLAGLDTAWKEGNVEKATAILTKFRENQQNMVELARAAAGLAKDPKAAQALEEFILRSSDILLRRNAAQEIEKNMKQLENYDNAKQGVAAQAERFWISLTGREFVPAITAGLTKVAHGFTAITNAMNANPMFKTAVQWTAIAGGVLMVVGALKMLATMTGLSHGMGLIGRLIAGAGSIAVGASALGRMAAAARLLSGVTGIGAALALGYDVYQNWDKIASAAERLVAALKALKTGDMSGLKAFGKETAGFLAGKEEGKPQDWGLAGKAYDWMRGPSSLNNSATRLDLQRYNAKHDGNALGAFGPHYSETRERLSHAKDVIGKARDTRVKVTISPIVVHMPASVPVAVTVTGTINGPVQGTGSGSVQTSATAPRGTATPDLSGPFP